MSIANPDPERSQLAEIQSAFDQVAAGSGLRFEYRGTTATSSDEWMQTPVGFGVVVDFAEIPGSTVGFGGAMWTNGIAMKGRVQLDPTMQSSPNPVEARQQWLDLMLHEIGHAVGIDHVDHRSERMFPTTTRPFQGTFGNGDLQGLRHVGMDQGCAAAAPLTDRAPTRERVIAD